MQVFEKLAQNRNAMVGALQGPELNLILNQISLQCIIDAGSRQIKYNLAKCKIMHTSKYILYQLLMSEFTEFPQEKTFSESP